MTAARATLANNKIDKVMVTTSPEHRETMLGQADSFFDSVPQSGAVSGQLSAGRGGDALF